MITNNKKAKVFLISSLVLLVLAIVLIEILPKLSKFESLLFSIIAIALPNIIIMLSAALIIIAKSKTEEEVQDVAIFLGIASFFIFQILAYRLNRHLDGESALVGSTMYWILGTLYTTVMVLFICINIASYKKN